MTTHDVFRVDREHFMVKEGLVVIAAILIGALVEALLGEVAIYAVAAAYFVSRVGVHERGRQRWLYMLVATVVGVALSALAVLVGDDTLRAVLLWSGTIYVAGLALAYGRSAFYAGYFLVFWVLFAMLTASRSPGEEIDYAASFLLGGIIPDRRFLSGALSSGLPATAGACAERPYRAFDAVAPHWSVRGGSVARCAVGYSVSCCRFVVPASGNKRARRSAPQQAASTERRVERRGRHARCKGRGARCALVAGEADDHTQGDVRRRLVYFDSVERERATRFIHVVLQCDDVARRRGRVPIDKGALASQRRPVGGCRARPFRLGT